MLNKSEIERLKTTDPNQLYHHFEQCSDDKDLICLLSNLGRLPNGFNGRYFVSYLSHPNTQVRLWAVKNLGKLKDDRYFVNLSHVVYCEADSMVKREAVSTIGRMQTPKAVPLLFALLSNHDPKIVLQAIRALLVFKHDPQILEKLKELEHHQNETIQSVIRKACFAHQDTQAIETDHVESPEFMRNVVVHGDVRETLKFVPDQSIHLTFTSPPYYNARDYSIYPSYQAYLDFLDAVFRDVYRITKEGRFLIVNTSPIIIARVSRQHASKRYPIPFDLHCYLTKMGWEFIDDIIWIKPETSVKNRNAGFLQHRKPLGYKPNPVTEYVMVYRKHSNKLLDWNMRQYSQETVQKSKIQGDYETSNAWQIDPVFDKVHSAVFPLELCSRIIRFYSYHGDLVFDPFGGSGTLGKAAMNLGRYFFMTEQQDVYIERMKENLNVQPLFANDTPRFLSLNEFQTIT